MDCLCGRKEIATNYLLSDNLRRLSCARALADILEGRIYHLPYRVELRSCLGRHP